MQKLCKKRSTFESTNIVLLLSLSIFFSSILASSLPYSPRLASPLFFFPLLSPLHFLFSHPFTSGSSPIKLSSIYPVHLIFYNSLHFLLFPPPTLLFITFSSMFSSLLFPLRYYLPSSILPLYLHFTFTRLHVSLNSAIRADPWTRFECLRY